MKEPSRDNLAVMEVIKKPTPNQKIQWTRNKRGAVLVLLLDRAADLCRWTKTRKQKREKRFAFVLQMWDN